MQNFLALILFGASIWGFLAYVEPTYITILNRQDEKAKYEEALANAEEIDVLRNKLMADYREVPEVDLQKVYKMVPDGVDNVRLLLDIEGIARRHAMLLSKISVGEVVDEDLQKGANLSGGKAAKYGSFHMAFSVAGQYENIKGFVTDLEKSLRLVDLDSLTINYAEKDPEKAKHSELTAAVSITTYWLKK